MIMMHEDIYSVSVLESNIFNCKRGYKVVTKNANNIMKMTGSTFTLSPTCTLHCSWRVRGIGATTYCMFFEDILPVVFISCQGI